MTDKEKTTQEEPRMPFESMPFAAMMQKIVGQPGQGCNCAKMMSQMMAMCSGTQDETDEEAATEESQKA